MNKKKKKKGVSKKRAQAKVKKQKKARSVNSKPHIHYIERPAVSEIDAPAGFRAVSMSQGMVEYARPIMEFVESGGGHDLNEAFQLVVPLWNYAIPKKTVNYVDNKKDILEKIGKTLKLNTQESSELFDMMIQRKEYLCPDEIQPDTPLTMFIRKEGHYLITEFDYESLNISDTPYSSDEEDEKLIQLINQMDKYIVDDVEYDEWEDHYFLMEEKCKERFINWLIFKGMDKYSEDFSFNIEIYLNFIYRYMHEEPINLKTVLPMYIEEFFVDYVLRKATVEPQEYVDWPPALKLFYLFLYNTGYLESPEEIIQLIEKIEPYFIEILRERYS